MDQAELHQLADGPADVVGRMVPQPTADKALACSGSELWGQRKAELVDERRRDKALVEGWPALTQDVADPLVPQGGQRGRKVDTLRARSDNVGNEPGHFQRSRVRAPGGNDDGSLAVPYEKARPEVEVHTVCHNC